MVYEQKDDIVGGTIIGISCSSTGNKVYAIFHLATVSAIKAQPGVVDCRMCFSVLESVMGP